MSYIYASDIPAIAEYLKRYEPEDCPNYDIAKKMYAGASTGIKEANIILINDMQVPHIDDAEDEHSTTDIYEAKTPLDIPFDSVFIEYLSKPIGWRMVSSKGIVDTAVSWIFCKEISFNEYLFVSRVMDVKNNRSIYVLLSTRHKEINEHLTLGMKGLVRKSLEYLNRKDFSCGKTTISQTIGVRSFKKSGKEKPIKSIKDVVIISPTKNRIERLPHSPSSIDWSHRWEVRGHWRKTNGIGKDRSGAYVISGYTWVSSHVRGPEDAVLIKKKRVIQEERIN